MRKGISRRWASLRALWLVKLPLIALALGLGSQAQAGSVGFSGAVRAIGGLASVDLVATPQWRAALQRQAIGDSRRCPAVRRKGCALVGWGGYLEALADEPLRAQIKSVNFFVNQVTYREDSEAWGSADYWATPREFFDQGGDCEDYAIAKYVALRALGVPAAKLFVLVVKDQIDDVMHAVLVVDAPDGPLVLDNRSDLIVPWREFRHYKPIYWVNEHAGWVALARGGPEARHRGNN